jgi:hypothetical protein
MVPLFRVFDGLLRVIWFHMVPSWNHSRTMYFDGTMMEHVVPLVPQRLISRRNQQSTVDSQPRYTNYELTLPLRANIWFALLPSNRLTTLRITLNSSIASLTIYFTARLDQQWPLTIRERAKRSLLPQLFVKPHVLRPSL